MSDKILLVAIKSDGVSRGKCFNAWTVRDNQVPGYEEGLSRLAEDEAQMLIWFG